MIIKVTFKAMVLGIICLLGTNAYAENREVSNFITGFPNIQNDQYVAFATDFEDDETKCPASEKARCDVCPIIIYSVQLMQGLADADLNRINKIIDTYVHSVVMPYTRKICKSPLHKAHDMIFSQAYVAYYSPDFVSIVFPSGHRKQRTQTLTIRVADGKIIHFSDVMDAQKRETLTQYLKQNGCNITLNSDTAFSLVNWFTGSKTYAFTIYPESNTTDLSKCTLIDKWDYDNGIAIDNSYISNAAIKEAIIKSQRL